MTADAGNTAPPDARSRIVIAGIQCVIRDGIAESSMAAIAARADVSKALLHYHFTDRAHLLVEIVAALGRRIIARERAAADDDAGAPVDALWRWVSVELSRGELRALLTIGTVKAEPVAAALAEVSLARQSATRRTIDAMFTRLGLTARVPVEVIADACLVFIDGLALRGVAPGEARLTFDVFWLAMLSLGE